MDGLAGQGRVAERRGIVDGEAVADRPGGGARLGDDDQRIPVAHDDQRARTAAKPVGLWRTTAS